MIDPKTLNTLPLAQKISAMEVLWDALCQDVEADISPSWHKDVLEQRKSEIAKGEHRDWNEAKKSIRRILED